MPRQQRTNKSEPKSFMDHIQIHERTWGTKSYPGRPDLSEILAAPVVVLWQYEEDKEQPYRITLHEDTADVERFLLRLLLKGQVEPLHQRFARVFRDQKRISISGVKIIFTEAND